MHLRGTTVVLVKSCHGECLVGDKLDKFDTKTLPFTSWESPQISSHCGRPSLIKSQGYFYLWNWVAKRFTHKSSATSHNSNVTPRWVGAGKELENLHSATKKRLVWIVFSDFTHKSGRYIGLRLRSILHEIIWSRKKNMGYSLDDSSSWK